MSRKLAGESARCSQVRFHLKDLQELCSEISGVDDEAKRCEPFSNIFGCFSCVSIAHIRGFPAAISDQARAAISKTTGQVMNGSARKTDFWILPQGTLALVRPVTQRASEWISQHAQDNSQWFGPALVIEDHSLAKLLTGIMADGLHVTQ